MAAVEQFWVAACAIVDTALLLALFDRRNRRRVVLPLWNLVVGLWLYHTGAAVQLFLSQADVPAIRLAAMTAMIVGLVLMPTALLHCLRRLARHGFRLEVSASPSFALLYLPLLFVAPLYGLIRRDPTAPFLELVEPAIPWYLGGLIIANAIVIAGFLRLRRSFEASWARSFARGIAIALAVVTVLAPGTMLVGRSLWPAASDALALIATVAPVVVALMLAYFILRFRLMQLVIARSIFYATALAGVLLFHQLFLSDLFEALSDRYRVDFALLELALLGTVILAVQPLRERAGEALRYLLGRRVSEHRNRSRELARRLGELAGTPPRELAAWFVGEAAGAIGLRRARVWLDDGTELRPIEDSPDVSVETAERLLAALRRSASSSATLRDAPPELATALEAAHAVLAIAVDHRDTRGLVTFDADIGGVDISHEQVGLGTMLVEQFGVALQFGRQQERRLAAERRAMQHQKLSALGLIASSVAHEIKNPLSSIKTIAAVMAEDASPEHRRDLELIEQEAQRLADTVTRLLRFARPASPDRGDCSLCTIVDDTLYIMRHVAKRAGVALDADLPAELRAVSAADEAVREIVVNLVQNAIQAAGSGGNVRVRVHGGPESATLEVSDDGPGISRDVEARLFEPFTTTKPGGTGLGLHLVASHVREAAGEIAVQSDPGSGTTFRVTLPYGANA